LRHHLSGQLLDLLPGGLRQLVAIHQAAAVVQQLQMVAHQHLLLVVEERSQICFAAVGITDRRPDERAACNGADRLLVRFDACLGLCREQLQRLPVRRLLGARYGAQAEQQRQATAGQHGGHADEKRTGSDPPRQRYVGTEPALQDAFTCTHQRAFGRTLFSGIRWSSAVNCAMKAWSMVSASWFCGAKGRV
jgi:hypothetical protein